MVKESNEEPHINLVGFDLALRDVISRTYGCPIINLHTGPEFDFNLRTRRNLHKLEPHCNILPATVAVETETSFILLFQPFIPFTLQVQSSRNRSCWTNYSQIFILNPSILYRIVSALVQQSLAPATQNLFSFCTNYCKPCVHFMIEVLFWGMLH